MTKSYASNVANFSIMFKNYHRNKPPILTCRNNKPPPRNYRLKFHYTKSQSTILTKTFYFKTFYIPLRSLIHFKGRKKVLNG